MSASSPSWLKETSLRFEDIVRHHAPPIPIYLPTLNEHGNLETLAPEAYELSQVISDDVVPASEYQWRNLAQESGIYSRRSTYFPRALLWRTVSGGTLTLHSVDSVRPTSCPRNRPLTAISFRFPVHIRPNCIGFSESDSNIFLYVLTEQSVLYLIHLSERVLSGQDRRPDQVTVITHRPLFMQARFGQGKLALEHPHFMHVLDDSDVIFAMQDGTLFHYNAIEYAATKFTGDASLRKAIKGWIPTWSSHNPYPAHIVLSSVASTKHSLLFTVSADQRLRIWSLETLQFVKEYDITLSSATSGRLLPQPAAHLLAIDDSHDHGEYLFYLLSYNPLEEGQFILWGGKHNNHGAFIELVQLQDPFKPVTPPGSTGIWNISDFFIAEAKAVSNSTGAVIHNTYERTLRLWVSWKSYYASLLQYTDITHNLNWITIMSEEQNPSDDEIENSVEFWTDRILTPGRFTDTVILTALEIYQNRLLPPEQRRDLSLSSRLVRKDMIASIVGCKSKLVINQHTSTLDHEKYRQELSLEFSQFEKTCNELSKPGDEFRRLSFDSKTNQVIVIRADGILVIRNLSSAEILHYGVTGSDSHLDHVVRGKMIRGTLYGDLKDGDVRNQVLCVARAAYKFRCAVAGGNLGDITAGLLEEVMSDSNFSVEDRLWGFYDKYLSDENFVSDRSEVVTILSSVKELSAVFQVLMDILSTDICQDDTVVELEQLTSVWGDIVAIGVAGTVTARWTLLRDFALLTAWLYSTEQQVIDPSFKKSLEGYWSDGLQAFKGVNMLRHLSTTEIASRSARHSPEDQVSGSLEDMNLDDGMELIHLAPRTIALRYLIEDTLDSSGVGLNTVSFSSPMALSLVIASILTQINFGDGYSGMAIRVVSLLVRLENIVEAARFARYLPNSPVGGYVWGRVFLEKGSWDKAATWFSRVAPTLAKSGRAIDFEYAKVVLRGKEKDGIGKGLFRYYEHVAKLFEGKHAHSQTIGYCQMALSCAQEESSEVRDDVLMLLFNNAVDVANYDDAHMALTQLANYQTQRAALETIIVAMVEHGQSARMCSFPFSSLQDTVDEILLHRTEEVIDIRPAPSYHKVLFAWRIQHGDFQGAASVMYQRLRLLRNISTTDMDVDLETLEISESYLAVINALSCVVEKNAWIFVSKIDETDSPAPKRIKRENETRTRMAMSLEEVRKEYVLELERQEIILGRVADEFGLDGYDI